MSVFEYSPDDAEARIVSYREDTERRVEFLYPLLCGKDLLDFGCGTGAFLLQAREVTKTAKGVEPSTDLCSFYEKSDLKVFHSLDGAGRYDVITVFHVIEHLPDPASVLSELKGLLKTDGQIIIETPNADDALLSLYESREFSEFTHQDAHLYLFNSETLGMLAEQEGLRVNYIKQIQRYPLSNHLHWLSKGKSGGHKAWSFLDSPELKAAYENGLASIGRCDTLIASFSI